MFGKQFAWLLWVICECSRQTSRDLVLMSFAISRAKEAVEKLTGDKVTAKH